MTESGAKWRLVAGNGYVHPLMHLAQYYLGRGQGERAVALWEGALGHFGEVDTGPERLGLIAAFQKHVLARYAGVLTRYHGAALSAGDHFLIVEQGPGTLTVRQPIGADTGLTLPLPPTWKAGDPIEVWAFGEQEQAIGKVSAGVTAQGITFTCRRWVSGQEVAYYKALNKGVRLGAFLPLVVSGLAG
ncbi:MAG: hypothetical protein ACUVXG_14955 [Anaerolineae bacterium]